MGSRTHCGRTYCAWGRQYGPLSRATRAVVSAKGKRKKAGVKPGLQGARFTPYTPEGMPFASRCLLRIPARNPLVRTKCHSHVVTVKTQERYMCQSKRGYIQAANV